MFTVRAASVRTGVSPNEQRAASRIEPAAAGAPRWQPEATRVLYSAAKENSRLAAAAFKRKGEPTQLNFQNRNGLIPAYQARQLVAMIHKYGEDL